MPVRLDEDARFRLLRLIAANPDISQRELSRRLGVSLGRVNYCLNALIEKGLVKMECFRVSDRKLSYAYVLTPGGLGEKTRLTRGFLARKVVEYEALKAEIESIQSELRQ
ncbi:MAG: MarR family EPS-associated transcriptional regulator [Pseudomonadota bacterium]